MTDEQFEQRMAFIVETLARVSINDEKRQQEYERQERRMDRIERVVKLMVRAGLRERKTRSEADERLTKALVDLADAQKRTEESIAHTDRRLDALIDFVRQQQNGGSQPNAR
jgi:predicted protein tyrosine phosphatase